MKILVRLLSIVFTLIFLVLLLGFAVQGFFTLISAHFILDRIFGAGYLLLGIMFSVILIRGSKRYISRGGYNFTRLWWNENKVSILLSIFAALLLFATRTSFFNFFLYGGYILGGFIVENAQLGIRRLTSIDILNLGVQHLEWIAEWYFLFVIISWISKKIGKFTSKT